MTELPAEAYNEVVTAFKANPAGTGGIKPESIETSAGLAYYTAENAKDGATNVRRYSMILPGGTFSGYVAVQVPENASKIYTDEAMRQMFASAVIRKQVPVDEQLALMPFKISELGDFKNVRTLAPGSAVLLADGEENSQRRGRALHGDRPDRIGTGAAGGSRPVCPAGRHHIPGVREARMTMSEPIRIDGMPGYETRIDAISGKDNPRHRGAMAAIRRPDHVAHHRKRPARPVAERHFRASATVRDGIQPR